MKNKKSPMPKKAVKPSYQEAPKPKPNSNSNKGKPLDNNKSRKR